MVNEVHSGPGSSVLHGGHLPLRFSNLIPGLLYSRPTVRQYELGRAQFSRCGQAGRGVLLCSKNSHTTGAVQYLPGLLAGAVGMATSVNSERSWNVSFGYNFTRRVRLRILKY